MVIINQISKSRVQPRNYFTRWKEFITKPPCMADRDPSPCPLVSCCAWAVMPSKNRRGEMGRHQQSAYKLIPTKCLSFLLISNLLPNFMHQIIWVRSRKINSHIFTCRHKQTSLLDLSKPLSNLERGKKNSLGTEFSLLLCKAKY